MFVLEQSSKSFHFFVENDLLLQQVVEVSDCGVEEIIEKEQRGGRGICFLKISVIKFFKFGRT
jgi:hypothetical protein